MRYGSRCVARVVRDRDQRAPNIVSNREIPLFPLRTVLFPDGRLPLRIFETRYMDMVRRCTRESEPFGVVLIRHGQEARAVKDAEQPDVFGVGTTAVL